MIFLLHGENSVASRDRLTALKLDHKVIELNVKDTPPPENSLFADESLVVIWEDHKLTLTQIKEREKKFPGIKVEEFKLPPVVFQFVDSLKPGNQKIFLPLWQKYLSREVPEIALSMITRQLRLMLNPESSDLASWQKLKITSQASAFGKERLIQLYKKILEIDYQVKSGTSATDLVTSLELLLLTL